MKITLWPAGKLSGSVGPVVVNPEPVADAPAMLTFVVPVFVRVSVTVWEFPI